MVAERGCYIDSVDFATSATRLAFSVGLCTSFPRHVEEIRDIADGYRSGPESWHTRYNGDIGLHHEYETRAKAYAATKKEDDQILVGPELFSALIDQAWARVKDIDPTQFRVRGGHLLLLKLLRPDFSKVSAYTSW